MSALSPDLLRALYGAPPPESNEFANALITISSSVFISQCRTTPAKANSVKAFQLLSGKTFAAKDNIDVAGSPTSASCPDFEGLPGESATVVQRLLNAGANMVGKTNLDQFFSGLVGTRSTTARYQIASIRVISGVAPVPDRQEPWASA